LLWSHSDKLFHLKEQLFLLSSNLGFIIFLFSFLCFLFFSFCCDFCLKKLSGSALHLASLTSQENAKNKIKIKKNFKTKYQTNANQIIYYLKVNTAKNTQAQIFPMKKKKLNPLFKSNYNLPMYIILSDQRKIDIVDIYEGLLSLLLKI